VPGTFKAGTEYWAVLLVQNVDASNGAWMSLSLGLHGTDIATNTVSWVQSGPAHGNFEFLAIAVKWVPTATRQGVTLRLNNLMPFTTADNYIGLARVIRSPGRYDPPDLFIDAQSVLPRTGDHPDVRLGTYVGTGNGIVFGASGSIDITSMLGASGLYVSDAFGVFTFAEHTPADYADGGVEIEVGDDYVGIFISEKDANTVQIYPDYSAGYDIELKDRGTGVWKMVNVDDEESVPSMGRLRQLAAAPGSPAEGDSYYDTTLNMPRTYDGSGWLDLGAGGGGGAPTGADYLVGTAQGGLSAEIVVGATPGGELGGTWASPTVDATHAGSTHIALGATEPGAVSTTSSGTAGSGSTASKVDHSHDLGFDDATSDPLAVSTAAADGTEGSAARKDHVHAHEAAHIAHDTLWDTAGDLVVGSGADTAVKLGITVPAANILNVLGVVNGETTASWKPVHDSTNPAAIGTAAPGTALTAAHRDHVHAAAASAISFTPNGSIAATDVQAAIQEVRDEAGGGSSPIAWGKYWG
jgi:hypothetical protein